MDKILRSPTIFFLLIGGAMLLGLLLYLLAPGGARFRAPMNAAERARELAREGKREQIITLSDGMYALQDSNEKGGPLPPRLFAIPVGQITLAEPQKISSTGSAGFSRLNRGSWRGFHGRPELESDDWPPVVGRFSNILIYDKVDGSVRKVFEKRIAVSSFKLMTRTTPRVLVITATSDDSDRNGVVDGADVQQLFIYQLDGATLKPVTGINGSAGTSIVSESVDFLVVQATLDSDRDGNTMERTYAGGAGPEPQVLYRVNLQTLEASPIVDQRLADELQSTLDGVAPKSTERTP